MLRLTRRLIMGMKGGLSGRSGGMGAGFLNFGSGEESEPDIATEQSMLTIFIATVFKDDAAVRQRWYVALETGARVMVQLWSL